MDIIERGIRPADRSRLSLLRGKLVAAENSFQLSTVEEIPNIVFCTQY